MKKTYETPKIEELGDVLGITGKLVGVGDSGGVGLEGNPLPS